jgi:single-strand DNA-binding protein
MSEIPALPDNINHLPLVEQGVSNMKNNLNSILMEGNLIRDPILRNTPKGTAVCNLMFSSNRYYRLEDGGYEKEVSFFSVEAWGKLGEACYERGKKGRGIRVVGRIKQDRWTDSDGKQLEKVSIVAEHIEFCPEFTGGEWKSGESFNNEDDTPPVEEITDQTLAVAEEELAFS